MKLANLSKNRWISFIGFALYFGPFLVIKVIPRLATSSFIFFLGLSFILVIPLLLLFALWGSIAVILSKVRRCPLGQRSKKAGQTALAGFSMFVLFLFLANVIPSQLPTGSYDRQFDREVWSDPNSTDYVDGDVTPRQKMLADVIKMLPGKSRAEIENMLGPSLDSPYFKSTGRNLIYITGPERDSLVGLDLEWLLIWVDENGIYQRHMVTTD